MRKWILMIIGWVWVLETFSASSVEEKLMQLKRVKAMLHANLTHKERIILEKIRGSDEVKVRDSSEVRKSCSKNDSFNKSEKNLSIHKKETLNVSNFKNLLNELYASNLLIQASKRWVKAGKYVAEKARALEYPFINFEIQWQRTDIVPQTMGFKMMQGNTPQSISQMPMMFKKSPYSDLSSAIGVWFLITQFGRKHYMKMMGQHEYEARKYDAQDIKAQAILKLVEAYLGALLAKKYIGLSEKYLKNAREHERIAENAYKQGMVVKSDVLRAKVYVATAKEKLNFSRNSLRTVCYAISMLLNKNDEGVCFVIKKNLRELKSAKLEDVFKYFKLKYESLDVSNNPSLVALKMRLNALKNQYKEIKSRKRPQIYFAGQQRWDDYDSLDGEDSWYVSIGAKFDLFKGGMDIAEAKEKRELIAYFKKMIEFKEKYLVLELQTAYANLKDAWDNMKVYKVAVSQAREQLKIVRNMYKNGMAKLVELLDAETALENTEVNYWKYVAKFWQEFFKVLYYRGYIVKYADKIDL